MGLGPDACLERNPRLVYGRITGWGQTGPLAQAAGHDLNYIALTGILDRIGRRDQPPTVPLNLVGDFGGGGLYLALGMLAGILETRQSGHGQVVDAAIVDGAVSLAASTVGLHAAGMLQAERGTNVLDSGAYFYDVYAYADGKWISVATIERRFHAQLLEILGIDAAHFPAQDDRARWDEARHILATGFATKTRDEWCKLLEGTDACFAPVLTLDEAPDHPYLKSRGTFITVDGVRQPAPAPRFSRTPAATPHAPAASSREASLAALEAWLGPEESRQWQHLADQPDLHADPIISMAHQNTAVPPSFKAWRIMHDQQVEAAVADLSLEDLTPGEVVVRTDYAGLNYKDALATTNHRKVIRHFPRIGGSDLAGLVVWSEDPRFAPGDAVMAYAGGLGVDEDGGFSEYVRLKSSRVKPVPANLSLL